MRENVIKNRLKVLTVSAFVGASALASPSLADDSFKVAVVSFLTGPAAGPFGVPGRNGAELVIDAINDGTIPAPYSAPGFGGLQLEAIFADESGGNAKQVAEYRNLVEKQDVDAVLGYISSGSCMSIAPVAEELKTLTVMSVCGTPRLFEGSDWKYTFRTQAHAVGDSVAAALYIRDQLGDVASYSGINQNYAWGQDSWKFFDIAMQKLAPGSEASDNPQFPKIFAGQYGTEISTLLLEDSDLVHSSFWDGDIEAFVLQASVRGFFDKKRFISVAGASAIDNLGKRFPSGTVIGTRGEFGILVREQEGELNEWFINAYKERYGVYPLESSYQYAQSVLALKAAMDKAAADNGAAPDTDQIIAAMTGLDFESLAGDVSFALGNGHQAIHAVGYGITAWDDEKDEPTVVDVKVYPAHCILPPAGQLSEDWLEAGMPGSDC
ncbi:ABC transporter substrate-binding protein [Ruegeria sp.]|uniref:ABC transporter substrate-binding protein n=1 Tax=Ruegeria sp. TaxID=1879320 RepID=UPI003C7E51DE